MVIVIPLDFPGGSVAKNPPANTGDMGSIPGLGKSPVEGNGNLLQHSCLENPMCHPTNNPMTTRLNHCNSG